MNEKQEKANPEKKVVKVSDEVLVG